MRGLRVPWSLPGLPGRGGKHRRPDLPVQVTLVLADGTEVAVPPESPLARSIGQLAALVAHW